MPDVQMEVRTTRAEILELHGLAWHFMHTYWENILHEYLKTLVVYGLFPVFIIIYPFLSYNSLKNIVVNYYG